MQGEPEHSGLSSSLSDLMTSLAVIFILLLVAMLNNALQQTKGTKSQVLSRFQETLKDFQMRGVEVQTDPKDPLGLLVVVPEGLLKFEQGKADIPQAGKEFVGGVHSEICRRRLLPGDQAGNRLHRGGRPHQLRGG